MIKVSVLYANTDGCKFDHDYYLTHHMPMIKEKMGPALLATGIDKGLAGGSPGSPAPYICMGYMNFESVESFQQSFGAHAEVIMADIPNYTDIEPVLQISEIVQ